MYPPAHPSRLLLVNHGGYSVHLPGECQLLTRMSNLAYKVFLHRHEPETSPFRTTAK